MSEFHRMITYLYLYERNVKTRNIGFAKIEKKDSQCLIELHMKNTGAGAHTSLLPVYFYVRKEQKLLGILLGTMTLSRGSGDFKGIFSAENIVQSGYCLADVCGIFLPLSEQIHFVSQWDDEDFITEHFVAALEDENTSSDSSPVISDLQAAEAVPKLSSTPGPVLIISDKNSEKPLPENTVNPSEKNDEKNASERIVTIPEKQGDKDVQKTPEQEDWNLKWKFILENFPVMTPFAGDENTLCVRLELKDLRQLPQQYWYLGNNSFLLHGFFNYRYIILGMTEESGNRQWFIGIPGVFQNPERVMAALFGFPEFRSEKESPIKTGEFGYWYRYLN